MEKGDGDMAVLGHVDSVVTACRIRVIIWVVWSLETAIICPEFTKTSLVRNRIIFLPTVRG